MPLAAWPTTTPTPEQHTRHPGRGGGRRRMQLRQLTRYLGNRACAGSARTTEAQCASRWRTALIMARTGMTTDRA
jgi:hypothetical protein